MEEFDDDGELIGVSNIIFRAIEVGQLEFVKRRVLAIPAVLEERHYFLRTTPLIHAVQNRREEIALWIIEHRGEHDVDTRDASACTALIEASAEGLLKVVKALVVAGAKYIPSHEKLTPLMAAARWNNPDLLAFPLERPAVKPCINITSPGRRRCTALSLACQKGDSRCVKMLLDAGADPTIPVGERSPLQQAIDHEHNDIADFLRLILAEPDRGWALHKARSLVDAGPAIRKIKQDARDKGAGAAEQKDKAVTAAPQYLKDRVWRNKTLPQVELAPQTEQQQQQQQQQQHERVRATAAFVVGLEEGGVVYQGLPQEVFDELMEYMMPTWADKGPVWRP